MISLTLPIKSFYIATFFYLASFIFYILYKKRLALSFLGLGLFINILSETIGRLFMWPYCNMFAEPFFLPLCFSALSFILISLKKEKEGLLIIPLVVIFSLIPIFCSEGYFSPFFINSKSISSHLFHLFNFIAHACFLSGAYLAIFIILGKLKEGTAHHLAIWGFVFYSLAGFFGMLWNYLGYADTISWDHYYFHSVAIWFYYSGFLHLYLLRIWGQKKRAWFLFGGFLLIFYFDYLPQIGAINLPRFLNADLY